MPSTGDSFADGSARRRTASWSLLFGYSQIAVTITRNILLVPLYLQFVQIADYGAWLATAGVLAQLFVSDFGLTGAVVQRASTAFGRRDLPQLAQCIGSSLGVSAALAAVLTVLSLALAPLVSAFSGPATIDAGTNHQTLLQCFVIVALANGLGLIGVAAGGVLRALQRPVIAGSITMAGDILSIAASVAVLFAGGGLYALAAGHAVRGVLLALASVTACLWVCRQLGLRPRGSLADVRSMFAASYYQFFTSVAQRLQAKADVFFAGLLLGPHAAAIYGLTARAAETVQMLSSQVVAALDAPLAHLRGTGNEARFGEVLRVALATTAFVGALGLAGVAAWNESFVALWVGTELFAGQAASLLLAAAHFVTVIGGVPYIGLAARGEFRAVSHAYVVSLLAYLCLLWVLTPLGFWGLAAATLVSTLARTLLLSTGLRRTLQLPAGELSALTRSIVPVVLPAFALAGLVVAVVPVRGDIVHFVAALVVFSLGVIAMTWLTSRRLLGELLREMNLNLGALRAPR